MHHFKELILEMDRKFNTLNIVLKRTQQPHTMTGRIHSLTESISIDNRIRALLEDNNMEYLEYDPVHDDVQVLAKLLKQEYNL